MKIAFIDKNKNADKGQFRVCNKEKAFFSIESDLVKEVNAFNPSVIFISKGDKFSIKQLKKVTKGRISAFFYGDYRGDQLPTYARELALHCNIVFFTWWNRKIYDDLNTNGQKFIFRIQQGTDENIFKPIKELHKDTPDFAVTFAGAYIPESSRRILMEKEFGNSNHLFDDVLPLAEFRKELMIKLMEIYGKRFCLVGPGWEKDVFTNATLYPKRYSWNALNTFYNRSACSFGINHYTDVPYYTSNRLYQGMAAGVPHISWRCPKLEEIIPNNALAEVSSIEELLSAIKVFNENKQVRDRKARIQRETVLQNFTLEHAWGRMEEIIKGYL